MDERGDHSFFSSWCWVGALLKAAPRKFEVLVARRDGALAGLALCAHRRRWRRQMWFNATGEGSFDSVMVEHNGFAVPGAADDALWRDFLSWFAAKRLGVDEVVVPGMAGFGTANDDLIVVEQRRTAFRTPLAGLGSEGIAPLLSRNARQQLRRSLRDFGGELRVDVAGSADEALSFFAQLKAFHVRSWTRRGRANAFDNPSFEPFHRAVIAGGVADGSVDLMRITAGEHALGYLYNFKRRGIVHSYQSGFSDFAPGLRPGYVCHALAISHYARTGWQVYDFLAGTNRLKQSFGTETYDMSWCRYRRPTAAFRLEDFLRRRLYQAAASRRKAAKEG